MSALIWGARCCREAHDPIKSPIEVRRAHQTPYNYSYSGRYRQPALQRLDRSCSGAAGRGLRCSGRRQRGRECFAEGIAFANLGDLVASSIQDDAAFAQLSALILLFSGGQIAFDSASQAVTTNAVCGLIPQLIGNIAD